MAGVAKQFLKGSKLFATCSILFEGVDKQFTGYSILLALVAKQFAGVSILCPEDRQQTPTCSIHGDGCTNKKEQYPNRAIEY